MVVLEKILKNQDFHNFLKKYFCLLQFKGSNKFTNINVTRPCQCNAWGTKGGSYYQGRILFFNGRLIFHILDHFPHPGSISTSRLFKSVILFLFDFKKRFMFRWKRFTFLLSLRQGILEKKNFYIIPRTRARKFSRAHFPHPRCGKWAAR